MNNQHRFGDDQYVHLGGHEIAGLEAILGRKLPENPGDGRKELWVLPLIGAAASALGATGVTAAISAAPAWLGTAANLGAGYLLGGTGGALASATAGGGALGGALGALGGVLGAKQPDTGGYNEGDADFMGPPGDLRSFDKYGRPVGVGMAEEAPRTDWIEQFLKISNMVGEQNRPDVIGERREDRSRGRRDEDKNINSIAGRYGRSYKYADGGVVEGRHEPSYFDAGGMYPDYQEEVTPMQMGQKGLDEYYRAWADIGVDPDSAAELTNQGFTPESYQHNLSMQAGQMHLREKYPGEGYADGGVVDDPYGKNAYRAKFEEAQRRQNLIYGPAGIGTSMGAGSYNPDSRIVDMGDGAYAFNPMYSRRAAEPEAAPEAPPAAVTPPGLDPLPPNALTLQDEYVRPTTIPYLPGDAAGNAQIGFLANGGSFAGANPYADAMATAPNASQAAAMQLDMGQDPNTLQKLYPDVRGAGTSWNPQSLKQLGLEVPAGYTSAAAIQATQPEYNPMQPGSAYTLPEYENVASRTVPQYAAGGMVPPRESLSSKISNMMGPASRHFADGGQVGFSQVTPDGYPWLPQMQTFADGGVARPPAALDQMAYNQVNAAMTPSGQPNAMAAAPMQPPGAMPTPGMISGQAPTAGLPPIGAGQVMPIGGGMPGYDGQADQMAQEKQQRNMNPVSGVESGPRVAYGGEPGATDGIPAVMYPSGQPARINEGELIIPEEITKQWGPQTIMAALGMKDAQGAA